MLIRMRQGNSCPTKPGSPVTAAGLAAANVTEVGLETLAILSNVGAYSEDCLYLNVWTKPQTGEKKKAVMIWLYGGGFNSGSGSFPGYNGQNIAGQEDVVVVSFK
jgi:cholinesterase